MAQTYPTTSDPCGAFRGSVSRVWITPAEWRSQPWKNGLGVTHEVWRDRDDYAVRVSVADDTTPAPFSRFPGFHRWSILLEPAPITLMIDGVARELAQVGDVVDHDGEAVVESIALPAGPTKLLSVLARPGYRAGVGVPPAPVRFVFALEATAALARWHARFSDQPLEMRDPVLWIAWPG